MAAQRLDADHFVGCCHIWQKRTHRGGIFQVDGSCDAKHHQWRWSLLANGGLLMERK